MSVLQIIPWKRNELPDPTSEVRFLGERNHWEFCLILMDKSLEQADDKHSEVSTQSRAAMVASYLSCSENTWNLLSDYTSEFKVSLQWLNVANKYYRKILVNTLIPSGKLTWLCDGKTRRKGKERWHHWFTPSFFVNNII